MGQRSRLLAVSDNLALEYFFLKKLFFTYHFRFSGKICGGKFAHIAVPLYSEMYFLCPSVAMLSKLQIGYTSKTNMYENMHMVSEEEFMNCEIDKNKTNWKNVLMCNNPKDPNVIKFNRFFFTSLPTRIAFQPNKTYYFIGKNETIFAFFALLVSLSCGFCQSTFVFDSAYQRLFANINSWN